ncbi:hypothetical protein [Levilactobacillus suantsaii]|uniref:Uncharacterized protein n=1 Tax=Levilactobacillus suantsaii TaxID=2292255 RepID=A0A4Q0VLJ9_9LACO|nr:hypothetical protein [Levilactobacillus suantsaii]RXI79365.1 hypothetical protein DXH47_03020 [Levilactobacillus suantsaii]
MIKQSANSMIAPVLLIVMSIVTAFNLPLFSLKQGVDVAGIVVLGGLLVKQGVVARKAGRKLPLI